MTDEPTLGEINRNMGELRRSFDALANKVLTVDVWKVEREAMERRFRDAEKDIADLQGHREADTREALAASRRAAWALLTAVVAPIVVGLVVYGLTK